MASLFENAVASLRMGVEDYEQQDDDRDISAVRNLYAGVLLLAKEALIRTAPNADPRDVIAQTFRPVPDGNGGLTYSASDKTIDFDNIKTRFKSFGLAIDHNALKDLNEIRNDMEHHFNDKPGATVRAAVVKAFPVISSLFRQMNENPVEHLDSAWASMLKERSLYDHEKAAARANLSKVKWHADFLADVEFDCASCGWDLIEQIDPENQSAVSVEFRCRQCGDEPELGSVIEAAVDKVYGAEGYLRAKDGGGDGPVFRCYECSLETYLEEEDVCAHCGETMDFERNCARCHARITIQDYLDGLDSGLCGYCSNLLDKVMQE